MFSTHYGTHVDPYTYDAKIYTFCLYPSFIQQITVKIPGQCGGAGCGAMQCDARDHLGGSGLAF